MKNNYYNYTTDGLSVQLEIYMLSGMDTLKYQLKEFSNLYKINYLHLFRNNICSNNVHVEAKKMMKNVDFEILEKFIKNNLKDYMCQYCNTCSLDIDLVCRYNEIIILKEIQTMFLQVICKKCNFKTSLPWVKEIFNPNLHKICEVFLRVAIKEGLKLIKNGMENLISNEKTQTKS